MTGDLPKKALILAGIYENAYLAFGLNNNMRIHPLLHRMEVRCLPI
jgi:hypothetical protein